MFQALQIGPEAIDWLCAKMPMPGTWPGIGGNAEKLRTSVGRNKRSALRRRRITLR